MINAWLFKAVLNSLRSRFATAAGIPNRRTSSSTIDLSSRPLVKSWNITEAEELRENILPLSTSMTIPPSGVCVLRILER